LRIQDVELILAITFGKDQGLARRKREKERVTPGPKYSKVGMAIGTRNPYLMDIYSINITLGIPFFKEIYIFIRENKLFFRKIKIP
jgi:hypothetical protein